MKLNLFRLKAPWKVPVAARCFAMSLILGFCGAASAPAADDLPALLTDRAAIERVYHQHRTGTKQPFEQAMPAAVLERLVRADLKKEAVLERVYGVKVTEAMVSAEVARIDSTTRAPEVLAEVKAALGNDPARFARSMARPIVIERTLRARFENDDKLHATQREVAARAREAALAASDVSAAIAAVRKTAGGTLTEDTWQLAPRPPGDKPAASAPAPAPVKGTAGSASYSIESTTQIAQPLGNSGAVEPHYFEDLPAELQNVLRVQLRKAGDVSAVIETPSGFLVFVAKARTMEALSVATLTIPKRGYDEWLAQQP